MARWLFYLADLIIGVAVLARLGKLVHRIVGGPATGMGTGSRNSRHEAAPPAPGGETSRDPVCGIFVSTEVSHRLEMDGETLHFCSSDCLEKYKRNRR